MGDEKSASQSTMKLGLWLTFIAFLLIIAVFHGKISEISFGEKGVSAKMMSPQDSKNLSTQERQDAQQALVQRASTLEEQAKSQPQPAPAGREQQAPSSQVTDAVIPNITGYWGSVDGAVYTITQNGSYVAFQGYSNGVLNVAGNGQVTGSSLNLQTTNLSYRAGVLSLQISQDGRQLNGTYTDVLTNQSYPMQIYR